MERDEEQRRLLCAQMQDIWRRRRRRRWFWTVMLAVLVVAGLLAGFQATPGPSRLASKSPAQVEQPNQDVSPAGQKHKDSSRVSPEPCLLRL